MVYVRPVSMRYFSALRFQARMFPGPPSLPSPMLFRKLSFWVPPMLPTSTTCFTPAATAASNWFFCPVQSTSSGGPLAQVNSGRPGSALRSTIFFHINFRILRILGFGTALVQTTSASQPSMADASASVDVTSADTMASFENFGSPRLSSRRFILRRSFLPDFSVRTSAFVSNWSPALTSCCSTSEPVRPAAPVTSTLRASLAPRSASSSAAASAKRIMA
mmetsp:Transcript_36717/g.115008  ORF Transcript_36717/g.115008 Transcript_36717/m.115008 type:complete len:220 (-) Transcript_36717:114-773(-)